MDHLWPKYQGTQSHPILTTTTYIKKKVPYVEVKFWKYNVIHWKTYLVLLYLTFSFILFSISVTFSVDLIITYIYILNQDFSKFNNISSYFSNDNTIFYFNTKNCKFFQVYFLWHLDTALQLTSYSLLHSLFHFTLSCVGDQTWGLDC